MRNPFVLGVFTLALLLPGCFRHSVTKSSTTSPRNPLPWRNSSDSKSASPSKGKMTLNVEGTNLDFPLDALKISSNSFQITGQGTKLVGSVPNPTPSQWAGKTLAIAAQDNVFGNSELDLPGTGIAPVTAGQIQIESASSERLLGKISFRVQGPFGERTFAGRLEVGIIQEK